MTAGVLRVFMASGSDVEDNLVNIIAFCTCMFNPLPDCMLFELLWRSCSEKVYKNKNDIYTLHCFLRTGQRK